VLEFFDQQPHLFDLIMRAEVLRSADADFPWQKARDESLRLLSEILKQGNEGGEFTIRDPNVSELIFQGGLRSVVRFGMQPRPADVAEKVVDVFLNGADAGTKARKALTRGCN
jgi:hypothetical protein